MMSASTGSGPEETAATWRRLWLADGSSAIVVRVLPLVLLAAATTVGLVLRLGLAWRNTTEAILTIPDDSFYYFQIAQNIANGHNVSFDGETLTNGFHPLWTALLMPIYFFVDDRDLALHLGLTIGALLGAATVILTYLAIKTLTTNSWTALAGATLFAIHPRVVADSVNGMETAVAVFTLAFATWLFFRVARNRAATPAAYVWFGIASGLMVLGRTDTAFVLGAFLLYLILHELTRAGLRSPLIAGGVASLVVAPWAIWSLVTFGTVIQISGVAVPRVERQVYLATNGDGVGTQLSRAWDVTQTRLFQDLPEYYFVLSDWPKGWLLLASLVLVAVMLAFPLRRQPLGLLLVPFTGVVAMLVFHAAIRWHVREWYFTPIAFLGVVCFGVVLDYFSVAASRTWERLTIHHPEAPTTSPNRNQRAWQLRFIQAGTLLTVVGIGGFFYGPQRTDDWVLGLPHRQNMLESALWLEANTEEDARIGSFNAGMIGYFSERVVVNLDGVVNEDAYQARRDGRMLEYMCGKQIDYLVDMVASSFQSVSCDGPPRLKFELIEVIGRPLFYFDGGQVEVLKLEPESVVVP